MKPNPLPRRTTMNPNTSPTIKIEEFGNGIFIKWKIFTS